MTLSRFSLSFINALFITTALLALMYSLIRSQDPALTFPEKNLPLDWVEPRQDSPVEVELAKPKPPKLIDPAPKIIKPIDEKPIAIIEEQIAIPIFSGPPVIDIKGGAGQLNLAFAVPPSYPVRMASRGIEGYVVVAFSVSASGTVFDPYVVEAEPNNGFNKAALEAIKRFKYQPRTVAGKGVATDGQFYKFVFELE